MTRLFLALLLLQAVLQTPTPTQTPTPGNRTPAPGSQSPTNASAASAAAPDPAAVSFATEFGLLLVTVKPDRTADYEAAITALQEVLSKSVDEEVRRLASGWRVFKAVEADAKANALYVHVLQPPVATADYRPSLWLDKLLEGAPVDLLAKYRDSFAGPPSKLALIEFANMAVAPVPKPANATPAAPTPPGKPANATPGRAKNTTPANVTPRRPGNSGTGG